jgi:hypothetical protein
MDATPTCTDGQSPNEIAPSPSKNELPSPTPNTGYSVLRCAQCLDRFPFQKFWCSSLKALFFLFVVFWLGSAIEERGMRRLPDTLSFYNSSQVCALVLPNNYTNSVDDNIHHNAVHGLPSWIQTFENKTVALASGPNTVIAHCETCGACSNPHDVRIYDETKDNLTDTTIDCAKRSLIWGRRTAGKCMERRVGFTPPCQKCWVENILCDLRYCLFSCVWYKTFGGHNSQSADGTRELNPCTLCDEKRCGPEFIQCAGANRRRSGIISDIERDVDNEVCRQRDEEWWDNQEIQDYFQKYLVDSEMTVDSKHRTELRRQLRAGDPAL